MLIVLYRCTALLAKPTALMTHGGCNCSTLILCAMLLQEECEGGIAALRPRLEEQQKDKAAPVEVSAAQAALLPAGTASDGSCHCQKRACSTFVITARENPRSCIAFWVQFS